MRKLLVLLQITFLALLSCSPALPPPENLDNRSIYYAWISPEHGYLTAASVRDRQKTTGVRFWDLGIIPMEGGFLVWTAGLLPGNYEIDKARLKACRGAPVAPCMFEKTYDFGPRGTGTAAFSVGSEQVRFGGWLAMRPSAEFGVNGPESYSFQPRRTGPDRNRMLEIIAGLLDREGYPDGAARARAAMTR